MSNKKTIFRGIDHIGITVPDIEEATRFLVDAFGAEVCYDVQKPEQLPMEGAEMEKQLGLPISSKIIHMRLMKIEKGSTIELFKHDAKDQKAPVKWMDYGLQHFALYTDDIEVAA
ncbi:VOC family protein [Niallia sp. 03133]|uniref:VOC family protein n=1 Tax=Niallia sp. 03133 TaxID=3458060 RepID=UPI004043A01C